jgi:hypothetical protein
MKPPLSWISVLLACVLPGTAGPATKAGTKKPQGAPAYLSESPLPRGWPQPGPYDRVVRKKLPAYRAAYTPENRSGGGFWRLFRHIKREGIPMTAPVEMKIDPADTAVIDEMGFLYQTPGTGEAGSGGGMVEVRDMPAGEVLSYAWMGPRNKAATARARAAVDAELARLGIKPAGYRLLGYNSPFVARGRRTHELQALLP